MKSNIGDKAEDKFREEMEKDKKKARKQIDRSKLEVEGACEIIAGKDEKEVCEAKT